MARRSFAVIGLGRFGSATASTLAELGQDVIGIDSDEERVRAMSDALLQAVQLDATDERALRAAGIHNVDVAVISIGENVESSVLIVMLVKELGIKTVVAKATTPLHGRILEKLGVTRAIFPDREMAERLAHGLVVPNFLDFIELSRDFSIVEMTAPEEFVGRTLKQIELRPRYGLTLIALKRPAETGKEIVTNIAPAADDVIRAGDVLTLVGNNDRLAALGKLRPAKS
jgi:trk system potassium uptake protein TrkA